MATASKSWLGTNSFGVGPIDQAGNWHSYVSSGAMTAVCCGIV